MVVVVVVDVFCEKIFHVDFRNTMRASGDFQMKKTNEKKFLS